MKICKICGETKDDSEFYKSSGRTCKKCKLLSNAEWAKNHPDRSKKIQLDYYYRNNDARTEYRKAYYRRTRERRLEYIKEYHARNSEHTRQYSKEYRELHPDVVKTINANRLARARGAGGSHTEQEWRMICNMYGNVCLKCGRSDVKLTRDHVVAVKNGGSNNIDNIQPLCRSCNSSKSSKNTDYRAAYYWSDWT